MASNIARQLIIKEEFDNFLFDMEKNKTFCSYIDVWEYEDDFSHNEIEDCRVEFECMVTEWLKENKPNEYYLLGGFDKTILMTVSELIRRNLEPSRYEIIK